MRRDPKRSNRKSESAQRTPARTATPTSPSTSHTHHENIVHLLDGHRTAGSDMVNTVGVPIGKNSRDTCEPDTKAGALPQGCAGNCSRDAQIVTSVRLVRTGEPAGKKPSLTASLSVVNSRMARDAAPSRRTVPGASARSSSSASERGGLLVAVNPEGQVVEEPVVQVVDETVKREPPRTLPRPLHDGCS